MSMSTLAPEAFDAFVAETEANERLRTMNGDRAFITAMSNAIERRRETVTAGTFVDTTSPVHARRTHPIAATSSCGSPASMCEAIGDGGLSRQARRKLGR